ncbi:MAG: hypothetical protein IJN03_00375 [Bacilli bacterium]|nr:hypothetical protein [Bacilli bacterium]
MFNLISRYMQNLSIEQVNTFALSKNINLSEDELKFTYDFVKKNWEKVIGNPNLLHLERYKEKFSEENFIKIKKLFNEYSQKYRNYL